MKTRKAKPGAVETDSPNAKPEISAQPAPVESEREKAARISFFVTDGGMPEWERMLPKTKEQLAEILRSPNVQKELGISPEEAKQIADMSFGEDEANALLDMIGGINSVAASKLYGIPYEITSKAFSFTPDHRKKACPPIAKVINKWAPMFLKTWKDEIGAAIILFAILNSQVRVMHILEDQRKKNLPARSPAPPVTPIFKPDQQTDIPVASGKKSEDTGA